MHQNGSEPQHGIIRGCLPLHKAGCRVAKKAVMGVERVGGTLPRLVGGRDQAQNGLEWSGSSANDWWNLVDNSNGKCWDCHR